MNRLFLRLISLACCSVLAASGCGGSVDSAGGNGKGQPGDTATFQALPAPAAPPREFPATVPVRMSAQEIASTGAWPNCTRGSSSAGLAGLPRPSALVSAKAGARGASYTIDELGLAGDEYDVTLPSSNVSATVTSSLAFAPLWDTAAEPQVSDAAYCIYRFQISNYPESGEPQTISTIWYPGSAPSDYSQVWVGFSDVDRDRWAWFAAPEDGVITVDTLAEFQYPSGELLAAVVVLDSADCALSSLVIGETESRGTGGEPNLDDPPVDDTPPPPDNEVLPGSIDFSPDCSPVEDQGSSPSCTCYAVARGAFDFKLGQLYGADGWDFGNDFNLSSTQYLFVLTGEDQGRDCDDGRYTDGVIQYLIDQGDSSKLHAGPGPCAHFWTGLADEDAALLRASLLQQLDPAGNDGVRKLKSALATHRRLPVLTMGVDYAFTHLLPGEAWQYEGQEIKGYHAVCIVGYDDAKQAFKIRNSWSTAWCDGGYGWISYQTFLDDPPELALWCQTLSADYSSAAAEHFCGAAPKLDPPTGLSASDGGYVDFVRLSWQAAAGATGYKVYRDSQASPLATLGNVLSWDDVDLSDLDSHTYWVSATGAAEESVFSEPDAGYLWTIATPEGLSASDGTNRHSIDLSWDLQAHVTAYEIYRDTQADPIITIGAQTDWADYSVEDFDTHEYTIRALGQGQESDHSAPDTGCRSAEPLILGVSPSGGDPQAQAVFTAQIEGVGPYTYSWSFGGGAVPNQSTEASPQVTLSDAGTYFGFVAVQSGTGEAEYALTVQVGSPPDMGPWPMFQQDGSGRRCAAVAGPLTNDEAWSTPCGFSIDDAAAIGLDGTLYFSTGMNLRALNPDGSYRWYYDGSFTTAPAVGPNGWVYAGSSDGNLYAFQADGTFRWKYPCDSMPLASPPATGPDGIIYVGGGNTMFALKPTGQKKWSRYLGSPITTSAALGPGGIIYFGVGYYLFALKPNGDLLWQKQLGSIISSSAAIGADGTVYAFTQANQLCAVFPDGSIRWKFDSQWQVSSSPSIAVDGTIYFSDLMGQLVAVNPDGSHKWTLDLGPNTPSTPAIDLNGMIFVNGTALCAVNPNGSLAWAAESGTGYGSPVIGADGTIYCSNEYGVFYAIGPGGS